MMQQTTRFGPMVIVSLACALSLAACASQAPVGGYIAPVLEDMGYPSQTIASGVYARGRYDPDSERQLGVDLVSKEGILPIKLTVRKSSEDFRETIVLKDERMNPRLYLPDGTVLYSIPGERVAEDLSSEAARKVREGSFQGDILRAETSLEGFLYFKIAPKDELFVDRSQVIHTKGNASKAMEITGCLLALVVDIDERPKPFYVGLLP